MTRTWCLVSLLCTLFLVGCSHLPQYATSTEWPNKDVLLVRVYLDTPLETAEYRHVAVREAKRHFALRPMEGVALYEVRCEFLTRVPDRPLHHVATVRVFPESTDETPWQTTSTARSETVVY